VIDQSIPCSKYFSRLLVFLTPHCM
jgi:hypothetical protein